jgi:hypothetical protein
MTAITHLQRRSRARLSTLERVLVEVAGLPGAVPHSGTYAACGKAR